MEASTIHEWSKLLATFLEGGSAGAFVGSLLCGWCVMIFVMFPIKRKVKDDELATWYCRAVCIGAALLIALLMWPWEIHWRIRLGWSITTGFSSPVFWWVITHALGWFAPGLAAALKLKRVSLDTDDTETGAKASDATPVDKGAA